MGGGHGCHRKKRIRSLLNPHISRYINESNSRTRRFEYFRNNCGTEDTWALPIPPLCTFPSEPRPPCPPLWPHPQPDGRDSLSLVRCLTFCRRRSLAAAASTAAPPLAPMGAIGGHSPLAGAHPVGEPLLLHCSPHRLPTCLFALAGTEFSICASAGVGWCPTGPNQPAAAGNGQKRVMLPGRAEQEGVRSTLPARGAGKR